MIETPPSEHAIVVPRLHGNAAYYQIVAWLKDRGDVVAEGDALLILETDKAAIELRAEVSGILERIGVPAGQWAEVGSCVGIIAAAAPRNGAAPTPVA